MPGTGKPFSKGSDPRRNTDGAPPKNWTWRSLLKRIAEEVEPDTKLELKELIARALVKEAVKGNIAAIKEFGDRIDGKPKQDIGMQGDVITPIIVRSPIPDSEYDEDQMRNAIVLPEQDGGTNYTS